MFSVIKQGYCSKLGSEFDKNYGQLLGLESQLNQFSNSLRINIADNIGFSPHSLISQFESDVGSNIHNMVPNLDQFDELFMLINSCVYTSNNSMLSNPSTMARGIKNMVLSNMNAFLSNLASMIPTEFNISNAINKLASFLGMSNVNLLVPELNQLLNCMSAICGIDVGSKLYNLQSFMSRYSINGLGSFDHELFLMAEGLGADAISSINRVKYQMDFVTNQIEDSFTSGIERLKGLYDTGFEF